MTHEMLSLILRHALEHLLASCSPVALRAKIDWLEPEHIQWMLDHLSEYHFETAEDRAARVFLRAAVEALHAKDVARSAGEEDGKTPH